MNHIYKVIWNKAKHCYTVVSEIAKSHSTSSVTKKKVSIAAILAAGMLSGFSPMVSGAVDNTQTSPSAAVVYDQNKTSLKSTNSNGVGKNAIALGNGASAVDDSIAIGNGASVVGGSNGKGGVALGKNAHAGYKGTSLGNSAISGREGTIVIGDTTNVQSLYSTVVGTNSTITSDGTAYTLDLGFLGKKSVIVQGAVSTSFGADNTITNTKKVFSGVANSIIGSVNTVTNSNGVTIQGTGNTVSNAYKDMNIGLGDLLNFKNGDYSSIAKQDNGAIAIIGGGNTISDQLSSTVIGFGNTLKGENSTGVFTAGSHNKLTNVSNSLVMGDHNTLEGRKNVISLGNKNTVVVDDAVAIGNGTTVKAESGVAIGVDSVADRVAGSEKGVLGAFAPANIPTTEKSTWTSTKGAVSVGDTVNNITRQITNVAAGSEDTDAVNVAQLKQVASQAERAKTTVSDGTNTTVTSTVAEDGHTDYKVNLNKDLTGIESMTNGLSSIRMGNGGTVTINNRVTIDQSGKISGVAAGEVNEGSTDAVNGSQLKGVENKTDKNAENIQKNTEAIAKNTADISKNAEAISKNTENIKKNSDAIAENAKNIQKNTEAIAKNTADISKNTEAIGKLDERVTSVEEVAKKHTTVSTDDKNVQISEDTNKDGGKDYKVSLNKDLNLSSVTTRDTKMDTNGVTVKDVSLTKDGLSIGNKTYVSNKGLNANDQKVTNVAAGDISEKSTDAVNGSQLFATNQQVAQNAQSINKLGNRINKVGAGAAALAALHPLDFDPDDKWDFAAGYGNYNGENAAAIGAYYRPNEDTMFSVGGSFGNGENMVNAGVSLKLGQGNHVSTSKVAMAKEIKDLRKELEGLKSALLDVNAGKKLDTSKLQLFPDVPKNHWAYEYVSTLKGNGALTGYPDGEFKGDRPMTRYEFATMLYKAMLEGATLSDKILKEFAPELERFTVDTVHQDKDGKPTVERVRTVKAEK